MAKTIEEIMQEYAKSIGWKDFSSMVRSGNVGSKNVVDIAKIFANSKLEEAAENLSIKRLDKSNNEVTYIDGCVFDGCTYTVNKQSILNLREEV